MPALASSSWYVAMSAKSFSSGMTPASDSWEAFTMIMNRMACLLMVGSPQLVLAGHLRAQALLLSSQLRRELGAEVVRLEHLPDLDLAFAFMRVRAALDPLDRLLLRLH